MTRFVNAAAVALVLAAAPATAQVSSGNDRDRGIPVGLALPTLGVAAAEEPTALGTNPAGVGFVKEPALQYFHEGSATPGSAADGLYAADSFGPLGVGFSMEWIRPGDADGPRYRRTRLGLTLGDGRALSAGVAWNWLASPDPALDAVASWDVGLTFRPTRWLSLGAAMLGNDAQLSGAPIPRRYDLGVATRIWKDRLTLATDLLADDQGQAFRATHLTFGAATETPFGLALGVQVQVPIRDQPGVPNPVATLVSLAWNQPHAGFTGGALQRSAQTGWLVGARLSAERYLAEPGPGALPTVEVEKELEERRAFLFFTVGERDPYGALVERLITARDDPEVGGLLIRIEGLPVGAGRVEELRGLLASVRARKPVLAYLVAGGTREYWLASGASAIAAPPGAPVFVNGFGVSQLFLKDALARLGIGFEVVKAGAYKSATEPLVRNESSPEAREALNSVLDDLYGRFVADVSLARGVAPERVKALVDQGLYTAEEAQVAGLVDAVLWPDEVEGWARRVGGRPFRQEGRYRPAPERNAQRWGRPAVIEVIRVEGLIARGKSREDPLGVVDGIAGAESVASEIKRAADDGAVKAIVLRVESPGGDGLASDLIWREVARARRRGKPVVASMGDVAASGGYLVAVGADTILAEPTTITGSIGVFAAKPDLSGLLEKLSIHREAFTRGENVQITSLARPWSPSERSVLERQIQAFYAQFIDRVAEGRKLSHGEVEAVAGGRVWTGRQAVERRLVDRLGSLADAIALAREKARLGPGDLVEVRRAGGRAGTLAALASGAVAEALPEPPLARAARALPELGAFLLLSELGPVLALPETWIPSSTGEP
jgi:protease-4